MLKLIFRSFVKITILFSAVMLFLILGNLYTYNRLTNDEPIAQLTFKQINSQEFDASLRLEDACDESIYKIYGDEWRIDAQFLKWKSWATLFGANAMYRIDRLSGRYQNINDELTNRHSAHALEISTTLNISALAKRYSGKFSIVDTVYGSSAYEKMKPDTLFTVFRTQSGILIRQNETPNNLNLSSCVHNKSVWKDSIIKMDQQLASVIHSLHSYRSSR